MAIRYTKHGVQRIRQRGFKRADAELIRRFGTLVDDAESEVYFFRKKDADAAIRYLNGQITRLNQLRGCIDYPANEVASFVGQCIPLLKTHVQDLERLRGCKIVISGDDLVTIMHVGRQHEKRLLRHVA